MTPIIEITQYILILSVGLLVTYQMLWSVLALKNKTTEDFISTKKRKFAVVLLANNGQPIVSKSLYSLSGLVYPKNLYDLIVVAEHSSEDLAKTARNLGAVVFKVNGEITGNKISSIELVLNKLLSLDHTYEALIIFDANSYVSGNYLEVMNYYLEKGNKIIQSSSLILTNPDKRGNKAECVDFILNNYVKPLGKKKIGAGLPLQNNGTCFAVDMLQQLDTNTGLYDKDVSLGLMFHFKNTPIAFAPEARVFIDPPLKNGASYYQQNSYRNIKKHLIKLWRGLHKNHKVRLLEGFLDVITPSVAHIITFSVVMCIINLFFWFYGNTVASFIVLWGTIGLLCLLHLFIGLRVAGSNRKIFTVLSYWPSYILAKLSGFFKWDTSQSSKEQLSQQKVTKSEELVSGS